VLLFIFSVGLLGGCASINNQNSLSHGNYNQKEQKVLVINSNQSIERYQIAEFTFVESMLGHKTDIVNLDTEAQPIEYLQDILNQNKYDAIYCIGAKALGSIDYIDPKVPVVYTAVLNWRRFSERNNYFGIASELSPQVQLSWFKYIFPEINNIGVLYSDENQILIEDAKKASNNLSLNLKAIKLRSEDQLLSSAKILFKDDVQALWLISDSSALSSIANVDALFKLAEKSNIPVFSYNPLFMDMGAMMSLVADLPTTARQAALMTLKILDNNRPNQAVQYPAGSRIIIDSKAVERYQIKLNPESLDSVDELR
jgi:ABC-type uncharacterized transport system substrate-binding protein